MRRWIILPTTLVVALLLFWWIAPRQVITSDQASDLDRFLDAVMVEESIPGLAIAVIRDRQIVRLEGRGLADVVTRRPMTADTPMNIASVSKPILGIVLQQLSDQGRLALDADISPQLGFRVAHPHAPDTPITVRQLATHTAGLGDYFDPADYTADADAPTLLADLLRALVTPTGQRYAAGHYFLDARPGSVREYSNLGAGLAGAVAEAVGGKPLHVLAREGVFAPLGMRNTSWRIADFPADTLAVRYEVRQCIPWVGVCATTLEPKLNYLIRTVFHPAERFRHFEAYPQYGNPNYPDGGVHSSVHDLALLTLSLLADGRYADGALLSRNAFEDMFRLQLPTEVDARQRFFWRDRNGLTGHAGSDLGVYTSLYFDRAKGDAIIVLMNRTPDLATEAAMEKMYARLTADLLSS